MSECCHKTLLADASYCEGCPVDSVEMPRRTAIDEMFDEVASGVKAWPEGACFVDADGRFYDYKAEPLTDGVAPTAHSKSEYKRRVTLGDANVQPPADGVQGAPKPHMVPLSDDGKSVFIDGFGEVPLAYPAGVKGPEHG